MWYLTRVKFITNCAEFANTFASWTDPFLLHSTSMNQIWPSQTAWKCNEQKLFLIKKFDQLIKCLFKEICVSSKQPNACGTPNFVPDFDTKLLLFSFVLGRCNYKGSRISFIALQTVASFFKTVHWYPFDLVSFK